MAVIRFLRACVAFFSFKTLIRVNVDKTFSLPITARTQGTSQCLSKPTELKEKDIVLCSSLWFFQLEKKKTSRDSQWTAYFQTDKQREDKDPLYSIAPFSLLPTILNL